MLGDYMGKSKTLGIRLDPESYNYIVALADALDLPIGYVARRLLNFAIELYRKGVIEFPEMTIKPNKLEELLKEILKQKEVSE